MHMMIEECPIEKIIPYERNPRINDAAVDAIADSIKEFGWRQPLVVDENHVIIIGHTRWRAAKQLGLATVPVHIADLPADKVKALRIADTPHGNITRRENGIASMTKRATSSTSIRFTITER